MLRVFPLSSLFATYDLIFACDDSWWLMVFFLLVFLSLPPLCPAPPNQGGLSPAPSTATAVQHDEQLQPG